jgi:hypothetical protein
VNRAAALFKASTNYTGQSKYQVKWQKSIRKVIFIKALQKTLKKLDELGIQYRLNK